MFDLNGDSLVDDSELAEVYEVEPCMKQFFKTCSKGKETFTEAEFCSCFNTVGKNKFTAQELLFSFTKVSFFPFISMASTSLRDETKAKKQ